MMQTITYWLQQQSWLEVAGVITGILCVWLAARNVIWNWPVAIISVCIYIIIFLEAKLYADMGLQVYFLAMNIYGWVFWAKRSKGEGLKVEGERLRGESSESGVGSPESANSQQPVTRITNREWLLSIIAVILFTAVLGFVLHKNTDAAFPFVDSFCTAISLVAQIFLARRVMENWLMWIFVDAIYVGVYLSKGLHLTAAMYALYIYIAATGYFDWKRDFNKQQTVS